MNTIYNQRVVEALPDREPQDDPEPVEQEVDPEAELLAPEWWDGPIGTSDPELMQKGRVVVQRSNVLVRNAKGSGAEADIRQKTVERVAALQRIYREKRAKVSSAYIEAAEVVYGYDGEQPALVFEAGDDELSDEIRYRIFGLLGVDQTKLDQPAAEYNFLEKREHNSRAARIAKWMGRTAMATVRDFRDDLIRMGGVMPRIELEPDNNPFPYDRISLYRTNLGLIAAELKETVYDQTTQDWKTVYRIVIGPSETKSWSLKDNATRSVRSNHWRSDYGIMRTARKLDVVHERGEQENDFRDRVWGAALAKEVYYGWDIPAVLNQATLITEKKKAEQLERQRRQNQQGQHPRTQHRGGARQGQSRRRQGSHQSP